MLYVLKPSHDSGNCVKVVSVSHCASVKYEIEAERVRNIRQSSWGDGFDWM